jgi:hypothetical protein
VFFQWFVSRFRPTSTNQTFVVIFEFASIADPVEFPLLPMLQHNE